MTEIKSYVLITGASSGIGRQIAIQLSDKNNIIICSRNIDKLNETKKLCSNKNSILIWQVDISKLEELELNLSNFIIQNNINICGFVHSAGVDGMRPIRNLDYEFILTVFNTNTFSFALISKILANKKINNPKIKKIVAISSNISTMGAKAFTAYGGSKAALDGMVRSMALEFAPNTNVNSISPGAIQTAMTTDMDMDNEVIDRMKMTYPMGWGKTSNIADAVEFLLSEKADWINGQNIIVDGGRTINLNG